MILAIIYDKYIIKKDTMANPTWVTSGGSIGTYKVGHNFAFQFTATPSTPGNSIIYTVYDGSVPYGTSLTASGQLTGVPQSNSVNTTSYFTVRATEFNSGILIGFSDRLFSVTITISPPIWNTASGSIGTYPQLQAVNFTFSGSPSSTGNTLKYQIISGSLSDSDVVPLSINSNTGVLSGIPARVLKTSTSTFTVRLSEYSALDPTELVGTSDRIFTMSINIPQPTWTTSSGQIWPGPNNTPISFPEETSINYQFLATPGTVGNNLVYTKLNGSFPNSVNINTPITLAANGLLIGTPAAVSSNSTSNFTLRLNEYSGSSLVSFNDRSFYMVVSGPTTPTLNNAGPWTFNDSEWVSIQLTYTNPDPYTTTTISLSANTLPPGLELSNTGLIQGYPSIPSSNTIPYYFTLNISNGVASSNNSYLITINKNLNTRYPTILNNRPSSFDMSNTVYAPYYFTGNNIGTFSQGDKLIYKIIGYDFDGQNLNYQITGLSNLGIANSVTYNANTGWISGTLRSDLGANNTTYSISATTYRTSNNAVTSSTFNYNIIIAGTETDTITWISDSDLESLNNGQISTKKVVATTGKNLTLTYSLDSGSLPPNIQLNYDGELSGRIPFESTSTIQSINSVNTYTFTVRATSVDYPAITLSKTFTITTVQKFVTPYDDIYIQAFPNNEQLTFFTDLVNNTLYFPDEAIYRSYDLYFGRRNKIIYTHMFGVPSNISLNYVRSVVKNHYRRNITLGELSVSQATDENNVPIYEVIYSKVIDDLNDDQNTSISKNIYWPRTIGANNISTLYPNSLPNMREQVSDNLGLINDAEILPAWMYSQQQSGGNSGYVPAVILSYVKPGWGDIIKNNIESLWNNNLNQINFQLDRFEIDRSLSYQYNSEIDFWNPTYNNTTKTLNNNLPSAVANTNANNTYIYFSENILTEANDTTVSQTNLPLTLLFDTTVSAGNTITLPLGGIVNVKISWGDGSRQTVTSAGNISHTYSSSGNYTVTVSGTVTSYGNQSVNNIKLIAVTSWGDIGLTNLSNAFYNASNLKIVPVYLPSTITDLSYSFYGASNFNDNLSGWNVSNITNMNFMFYNASLFNVNIGSWNVSSVTSMTSMFQNATNFNQNLSNWCVKNISSQPANFSTGSALTVGNLPIWGTCPDQ